MKIEEKIRTVDPQGENASDCDERLSPDSTEQGQEKKEPVRIPAGGPAFPRPFAAAGHGGRPVACNPAFCALTGELLKSTRRFARTLEGAVLALSRTVGFKDPYTARHQKEVARLACAIARRLGLSGERITGLRLAALVHDVGKVAVPSAILNKPGPLSKAEFMLVKTHPRVSHEILRTIEFPWPLGDIVLQHHERLDGSGYPGGCAGDEILLEARILGVADVVEAMASHRPYRPAPGIGKALEEISARRGVLYDPDVVDVCISLFEKREFSFRH